MSSSHFADLTGNSFGHSMYTLQVSDCRSWITCCWSYMDEAETHTIWRYLIVLLIIMHDSPMKPAIRILLVNPSRWFPHFQAAATFYFVCVDVIAIHWWGDLSFNVESFKPIGRKFLVYFSGIFFIWKTIVKIIIGNWVTGNTGMKIKMRFRLAHAFIPWI